MSQKFITQIAATPNIKICRAASQVHGQRTKANAQSQPALPDASGNNIIIFKQLSVDSSKEGLHTTKVFYVKQL